MQSSIYDTRHTAVAFIFGGHATQSRSSLIPINDAHLTLILCSPRWSTTYTVIQRYICVAHTTLNTITVTICTDTHARQTTNGIIRVSRVVSVTKAQHITIARGGTSYYNTIYYYMLNTHGYKGCCRPKLETSASVACVIIISICIMLCVNHQSRLMLSVYYSTIANSWRRHRALRNGSDARTTISLLRAAKNTDTHTHRTDKLKTHTRVQSIKRANGKTNMALSCNRMVINVQTSHARAQAG